MNQRATALHLQIRAVLTYRWPGSQPPTDYESAPGGFPEIAEVVAGGTAAQAAIDDAYHADDLHEIREALRANGFAYHDHAITQRTSYTRGRFAPLYREIWTLNPGRADVILNHATHLAQDHDECPPEPAWLTEGLPRNHMDEGHW